MFSLLGQENYAEKLGLLQQAHTTPISQWKASQVLAWLEIEMNMPMYAKACAENIKSGKVRGIVWRKVYHVPRFWYFNKMRQFTAPIKNNL